MTSKYSFNKQPSKPISRILSMSFQPCLYGLGCFGLGVALQRLLLPGVFPYRGQRAEWDTLKAPSSEVERALFLPFRWKEQLSKWS